ncbi:unnamed protein product [Coffea canephora]|uniref:Pentacotripeptide-repeat region of PRORP domain-containing protein n=1 Tax=Coffea canephora TaxID=49390 RepID=A0A068UPV0_COFCA|nr:unnamed protein product [Coffea canephora]
MRCILRFLLRPKSVNDQLCTQVSKFQKCTFSVISKSNSADKSPEHPIIAQRNDRKLGPLFNEILAILGAENEITDQNPTGFSSAEVTDLKRDAVGARPSQGLQDICLNSQKRVEQQDEILLVSENTVTEVSDGIDVSPMVHKVTEIVRGENRSKSMEEKLEEAGFEYNVEIVENVLKRCFKVPQLALRFFNWVTLKAGFRPSTETYNIMIYIAGEAKDLRSVDVLLEEMEKNSCQKDIKTWTILIDHYGKAKLISKALLTFEKMKKSGLQPDVMAYKVMLLNICKAGKGDIALEFYKEMIHGNMRVSSGLYQQLLKCLACSGHVDAVYAVGDDMIKVSEIPEHVIYGFMLKSFCIAGRIREALELIRTFKDKSASLGSENINTLVKGLCRADRIADALEIVDIMKKKNSVDEEMYGIIINGYLRKNDVSKAFDTFENMKVSGCSPTVSTYTTLMQHLIRMKEFQKAMELYNEVMDVGVQLDSVATTAIVAGYISQNRISDAWQVLNNMLEKGVRLTKRSYSIFIKELCKVSATDEIVNMLIQMQASQVKIGNDIFQFVILYMMKKGEMDKVKNIKQMQKSCNIFSKEEDSPTADIATQPESNAKLNFKQLEQQCLDCNVVESTSSSYNQDDLHEVNRILSSSKDWWSLQDKLEKRAIQFTPELVVDTLRKCSLHGGAALRFFSWVAKQSGYRHNTEAYNMAIKLSGQVKDFKHMRSLFHEMRRNGCSITSDTWTIMIMQYGRVGLTNIALTTFREMKASSCNPNASTYKFLIISLCGEKGRNVDEAILIYQEMIKAGFQPDKELLESYLGCLCQVGKLLEARRCVESLRKVGFTVSLTRSLYIRALCRGGRLEEALELIDESGSEKHTLEQYTCGSLVNGLLRRGRVEEAMSRVESMKQVGIHPTVHVYTSLMVQFFRQKQVSKALETFKEMKEMGCQPTTVTYSAIVRGYMEMGKITDAWEIFRHMKQNGPFPDFKAYSMFIACLCRAGRSEEALPLFDDMLDAGIIPSTINFRTVLFGLNREGKHDLAQIVLRKKLDLKRRRKSFIVW